ncbi:MAG: immunoglobulin domain-containing protein, partial [Sulfuricaulis sp.]|nr:immunoglobulin domain-containing protein [Sulfuricaulis sp.]
RLALQYWQDGDYPDYPIGEHEEYGWIPEHTDYEWNEELGEYEPVEIPGQNGFYMVTDYASDGLYGSRWDTTIGTFGHPLYYDSGAFNPAATDRGYLLNTYPQYSTLTFRAWVYAPSNNCNTFTVHVYHPSNAVMVWTNLASGGYFEWPAYLSQSGIYRIDIAYSGATSTSQPNGTVSYRVAVGVGTPPAIDVHPGPASQAVNAGANVSYSVTATGATAYQWYKNASTTQSASPIAGATSATLALSSVQPASSDTYRVAVSNGAGTTWSSAVVLVVNATAPTIATQPQPQTVNAGQNASFTVVASGTAPLTYQWRKGGVALLDGGAISGAILAALTLTGTVAANAGNYDVVVSNDGGSVTSATAALTVNVAPGSMQLNIHSPLSP